VHTTILLITITAERVNRLMFRQDAENTLKNTISMRNRAIARGEEVFEESTGCPEWPMTRRDAVAVDPMGLTVLSRGWADPSSGRTRSIREPINISFYGR
jgi:hypothetical protein